MPADATAQEALLEAYAETGQSDALYTELGARLYGQYQLHDGRHLSRSAAGVLGTADRAERRRSGNTSGNPNPYSCA